MLEIIELSGSLVTIDAMGCQTEIAEKILAAASDDWLAVKGHQPRLHQGILKFFDDHLDGDFAQVNVRRHETKEKGHGREKTRHYFVCPVPNDLPDRARWSGLQALGIVISSTQRGGTDCGDVRYHILSQYLAGKRFAAAVRGHWAIENRLHWQLDVTFQEDPCRLR